MTETTFVFTFHAISVSLASRAFVAHEYSGVNVNVGNRQFKRRITPAVEFQKSNILEELVDHLHSGVFSFATFTSDLKKNINM